ncbi:hypothetical protein R1sor_009950 [Riccia sorocarpa]|uniref:Reverse transcriptase n=1 Tax=Riccia sorocarpa TaxID=122646 RepID=A0ABD3HYK2_9MARC
MLNLSKSIIIPMALTRNPQWLVSSGCKVLQAGETTTYLGCKLGRLVGEEVHCRDLADRMQRRLVSWKNRALSWTSKMILIRHILRSIPVYQFLGIGLQDSEYKKLETPCRIFLWGVNTEGRAKTSLVAWNQVTTRKILGGLQIMSFRDTADILKMRYVCRVLQGEETDWANLFRFFVKQNMQRKAHGNETANGTPEEGLLLLDRISCSNSSVPKHIVKSWRRLRRFLTLDSERWELPRALTWWQLQLLDQNYGNGSSFNSRVVNSILKRLGFTVLMHLYHNGQRINIVSAYEERVGELQGTQRAELNRFQQWLQKVHIGPQRLQQSPSWRWKGSTKPWSGWEMNTRFWRKSIQSEEKPADLTDKWPADQYSLTWGIRWKILWARGGGTLLYILAAAFQTIWNDRNQMVFNARARQTPLEVILRQARGEVEASFDGKSSEERWHRGQKVLTEISMLLGERDARGKPESTSHDEHGGRVGTERDERGEQE